MRAKQMPAKERKEQLIRLGLQMALKQGYHRIKLQEVADASSLCTGSVLYYFTPFTEFKNAVLRRAIKDEITEIIAQGMASNDPITADLPKELKTKVLNYLVSK